MEELRILYYILMSLILIGIAYLYWLSGKNKRDAQRKEKHYLEKRMEDEKKWHCKGCGCHTLMTGCFCDTEENRERFEY